VSVKLVMPSITRGRVHPVPTVTAPGAAPDVPPPYVDNTYTVVWG
jgi:hypothetical protein